METYWTEQDKNRLNELVHKETRTEAEEVELSILVALRTITIIRRAA